jgi:hypothetical protein
MATLNTSDFRGLQEWETATNIELANGNVKWREIRTARWWWDIVTIYKRYASIVAETMSFRITTPGETLVHS